MNLTLQRYNICIAVVKYLGNYFQEISVRCGGTINEGHFILFDRRPGIPWDEKIWHRTETFGGRTIEVWGM